MLQVFLVLLTAVTFVLMAADPRPTDSTEAKSAWSEQIETAQMTTKTEIPAAQKSRGLDNESDQT
ncbi:hypothetical protein [Acinetobacter sp. NIPH 2100]|uniref:ABZJ_00068 family colistin stress protein n=1 Tax=Acinetobacter sp. NIPH 2100 TaxID=1217708 RepID=UPI0002D10C34|nr:hypothetical protein [Acinetobacter sp. NIPH 2100]ENX44170.1 hypothetical protein F887_00089 [Acinetobacter sp. NIPH 2100]